jgi:hypothetical protein
MWNGKLLANPRRHDFFTVEDRLTNILELLLTYFWFQQVNHSIDKVLLIVNIKAFGNRRPV